MAATVDNLASHYSYRVIRGFADANGVQVPFDAVGVIRPRIDELALRLPRALGVDVLGEEAHERVVHSTLRRQRALRAAS